MNSTEEWVYQAVAQRADEIREMFGYDEDLNDYIDEFLKSLEPEMKKNVDALVTRILQSQFDDFVSIYRGAFRDGLRYGIMVLKGEVNWNDENEEW